MKISSSFKDNELYIHELQKELEDVTQENEVMRA